MRGLDDALRKIESGGGIRKAILSRCNAFAKSIPAERAELKRKIAILKRGDFTPGDLRCGCGVFTTVIGCCRFGSGMILAGAVGVAASVAYGCWGRPR